METNYNNKKCEGKMEGRSIMTIEKALILQAEEFDKLAEECKGFNDEKYKNHPVHNVGETSFDFIEKGSVRIKSYSVIKGNLI